MEKTARMLDVLDRAYSGPLVDEKEFDLRVVAGGVARVIKQYGIKFDRRRIIQYDDDLVDRVFQAAVDFLCGSGIFHKGAQRLITFTRAEVEQAARQGPDEISYGEGADARVWRRRTVGDPRPPHVSGGPIGTPLSEDRWITIMQSYWQEPLIDLVVPGTLATSFGREVRSRSAYEIIASWQEARCGLEAARRAGRPGIARMCVEMAISDIGHLSSISRGGFSPSDVHVIPLISEMKTNDELLNKVAHSIEQDGVILGFYNPILGGLGGPAEGVAVLIVAGFLALQMVYFPHSVESCPTHPFNSNSTDPHILRAVSAACAALARNTNLFTEFMTSPISGPCTPSLLYECIAMAATASSCGASRCWASAPRWASCRTTARGWRRAGTARSPGPRPG